MQRAAVDIGQGGFPFLKAAGLFVADIVPIVEEYASFWNPNSSVGYFHWVGDLLLTTMWKLLSISCCVEDSVRLTKLVCRTSYPRPLETSQRM